MSLLRTLYIYHCAVNAWFDEFVYNTVNDISGKEKYEPGPITRVFGRETLEAIKKRFNENGKEESNKYELLMNVINAPKSHDTFQQICSNNNIKNTRLFKNFIGCKAKRQMSVNKKKNEYLKAIKRAQRAYIKAMYEGYKLV